MFVKCTKSSMIHERVITYITCISCFRIDDINCMYNSYTHRNECVDHSPASVQLCSHSCC